MAEIDERRLAHLIAVEENAGKILATFAQAERFTWPLGGGVIVTLDFQGGRPNGKQLETFEKYLKVFQELTALEVAKEEIEAAR